MSVLRKDVQSFIASVKELLRELQGGKLTQKAQLLIGEIWESLDRIGDKDG